jgi:multidrug efflux pump
LPNAKEEGMSLVEATVAAAKLRLRPILMTSLAFTCGVFPLVIASGASSETQHALGTGVFGGMISAILAIFFVPVFFIFILGAVEKLFSSKKNLILMTLSRGNQRFL